MDDGEVKAEKSAGEDARNDTSRSAMMASLMAPSSVDTFSSLWFFSRNSRTVLALDPPMALACGQGAECARHVSEEVRGKKIARGRGSVRAKGLQASVSHVERCLHSNAKKD